MIDMCMDNARVAVERWKQFLQSPVGVYLYSVITGVIALTDTTLVSVSRDAMNAIVQKDHRLARQIGEAIEMRRRAAREALAELAQHGAG